jgi:hydrogenase maturation protease
VTRAKILIVGVGNPLFGDDGFGVEVVRRLAERPAREGVRILAATGRSLDLSFALLDGCDAAIVVDAARRGGAPGSLYVLDPETQRIDAAAATDAHAIEPGRALAWARANGGEVGTLRIVGCEPLELFDDDAPKLGLSPQVAAAVEPACALVERLAEELAVAHA